MSEFDFTREAERLLDLLDEVDVAVHNGVIPDSQEYEVRKEHVLTTLKALAYTLIRKEAAK